MTQQQKKNIDPFQQVKDHILKYTKPSDTKAWQSLATTAVYEAVAVVFIRSNLSIFGWVLHTLNIVRWFCTFHELAHNSFFSNPSTNKFFGSIIGVYVHFPYNFWRDGHNHHHRNFGNLNKFDPSQTILFTKQKYQSLPFNKKLVVRFLRQPLIYFFITVPSVWFFGMVYLTVRRYGVLSRTFLDKCLSFVLYVFLFPFLGISSFKMTFSLYIAMILGTIIFHLNHSVNVAYRKKRQNWTLQQSALQGSTLIKVPIFLRNFTLGVEYHHIHHFNTNVASYAIQDCHQDFQKTKGGKGWDHYNVNIVDYWTSIESMINVMYDEEKKMLIPFSYTHL